MSHAFVVRGRIGELSCDAVLIPTDADFVIESWWSTALGDHYPAARPSGWKKGSVHLHGDGSFVFVDVASHQDPSWLGGRVRMAIDLVAARVPAPQQGRQRPLLAMPMVGIGRGGHDANIGEVIAAVLDAIAAASEAVDVVLVIPDASVYSAVQSRRARTAPSIKHSENAERLGELARTGRLAVVFGAGLSVGSGLPSWHGLLETLSAGLKLPAEFDDLDDLDKAELLQLLIEDENKGPSLGERIAAALPPTAKPSLSHALLASLGAREFVTTNYDDLFERALDAAGSKHKVVLPQSTPQHDAPWLLKLHGDLEVPESLVLTRGSFVGFDAQARPAGAVLQSLLLTRHVLFVGVSMTDSNLLRLVHEVTAFVQRTNGRQDRFGTLVNLEPAAAKRRLWERDLHWLDMPGSGVSEGARNAAIFLDAVAMHASNDTSWLLDPRFAGLLSVEEQRAALALRDLLGGTRDLGGAWAPVHAALERLGAPQPGTGSVSDDS